MSKNSACVQFVCVQTAWNYTAWFLVVITQFGSMSVYHCLNSWCACAFNPSIIGHRYRFCLPHIFIAIPVAPVKNVFITKIIDLLQTTRKDWSFWLRQWIPPTPALDLTRCYKMFIHEPSTSWILMILTGLFVYDAVFWAKKRLIHTKLAAYFNTCSHEHETIESSVGLI